MARSDEITSTEKLLEVIRKKPDDLPPAKKLSADQKSVPEPPCKEKIHGIPKPTFSSGTPVTVGVEIGQERLRMVKAVRGAAAHILDYLSILIPATSSHNSADFAYFLKRELNEFCLGHKNIEIWAVMPSTNVEIRHVRIPRVAKKQIETAVYWAVRKETPFNEAETILDYTVLGEVVDKGINKLEIMYYTVPRREVEEQKKLFDLTGWPLTGLSIAPFAMQNILRTYKEPDYRGTIANLFIGNDFSRIDIFSSANLVMTRDIKAGMSSMVEAFIDGINEKKVRAGESQLRSEEEKDHVRTVMFSLSPDNRGLPAEDRYGFTERETWEMVLPALERLVRQVERTIEYFAINMGSVKVGKVYVSGEMNVFQPITDYVGEQLGIPTEILDPFRLTAGSPGEGGMAVPSADRISLPVLGIALSDVAHTPNFLFTHKDKHGANRIKRVNLGIFAAFFVCAFLCTGYFLYQMGALRAKEQRLSALNVQLSQFSPLVTRDLITQTAAAMNKEGTSNLAYYEQYEGMAIIAEMSHLTSPDIRLLTLRANLGAVAGKPKDIEIEGFVMGDKKSLEGSLAAYLIKLDNSPLFNQVKIQKTSEEATRRGTMLRFTATMKVAGA